MSSEIGTRADGRTVKNGSKFCNGCKRTRHIKYFQPRLKRGITVLRSRCEDCERRASRQYWASDPVRRRASKKRYYNSHPDQMKLEHLSIHARRFGVTRAELITWIEQESKKGCAICGCSADQAPGRWKGRLNIDHDHSSQKLRGLLCHNCNQGLGYFKDKIEFLEKAILYLNRADEAG